MKMRLCMALCLALGLALGCGDSDGDPVAEGPGATGTSDESGSSSTGEPVPAECGDGFDDQGCAVCDIFACGGKTAVFNHFGCPRTECASDADCASSEACYVRAFGASCLSSFESCTMADGVCECTGNDDCGGIVQAHCLPTGFYPTQEYCDLAQFECGAMPGWIDALNEAWNVHTEAGNDQVAQRIDDCRQTVSATYADCSGGE